LLEFVLRREADRYRVGDPEVKARALASGLRILAKTDHENTRTEYARRLSSWIKVDPNILFVELDKVLQTGSIPKATTATVLRRSSTQVRLEREAIKIALQFPAFATPHVADTGPEYFSVPSHRAIWTAFSAGKDAKAMADALDDDARRALTELTVQAINGDATDELADDIFLRLKEFVLTRQIDEVKARLQALNPTTNRDEHWALYTELIELERTKRALTRGEGE
jgi:DNA primase